MKRNSKQFKIDFCFKFQYENLINGSFHDLLSLRTGLTLIHVYGHAVRKIPPIFPQNVRRDC